MTRTAVFDGADRITSAGYSYDNLGRTVTVPAVDAVGAGSTAGVAGDLAVGFYDNDMAATLSQGAQVRSYALDPAGDRILSVDDGTVEHVNVYTEPGDSPGRTITQPTAVPTRTPGNTSWERHLQGPDGVLAGTQASSGAITWNITDPQGSVIATTPGAGATPSAGTTWTEYGQPRIPAKAGVYGWLGKNQRSADTMAGLTLMGVRLYNPATGQFLTVDPVYGGNTNPYTYPTDSINSQDLDGKRCWSWLKWAFNSGKSVGRAATWTGKRVWGGARWVGGKAWQGAKRLGKSPCT